MSSFTLIPDSCVGPVGRSKTYLCKCAATGHNFYETSHDAALEFLQKYQRDGATVDIITVKAARAKLHATPWKEDKG